MSDRRNFLSASAGAVVGGVALGMQSGAAQAAGPSSGFAITVAANSAPQSLKDVADFVCNGVNDQVTIQQAIDSIQSKSNGSPLGGTVVLSPGSFWCSGPIKLRERIELVGSGRATIINANQSFAGAVVQILETERTAVSNLAIHGGQNSVHGILINVKNRPAVRHHPDATNYIDNVYIYNVGKHGVYLTGNQCRASILSRIRVFGAGGIGFYIDGADGFINQCEAGSCGSYGFLISKSNNRFTNCKAWFSNSHGFFVNAERTQMAACESQDNAKHGFYLASSQVSLTSCHADSNGFSGNGGVFSGFYLKQFESEIQLIGCQAYDKNEAGRGFFQRWGFCLQSNNQNCQITGIARNNTSGALFEGNGSANNSIDVIGT